MIHELKQRLLARKYNNDIISGRCDRVRLNYLNLKIYDQYDGVQKVRKTLSCTPVYKIPAGLDLGDVCAIFSFVAYHLEETMPETATDEDYISYACQFIENRKLLEKVANSEPVINMCTEEELGLFSVSTRDIREDTKHGRILDLFGCSGDDEAVRKCDIHDKTLAWFLEGVSEAGISKIKTKARAYQEYYASKQFIMDNEDEQYRRDLDERICK